MARVFPQPDDNPETASQAPVEVAVLGLFGGHFSSIPSNGSNGIPSDGTFLPICPNTKTLPASAPSRINAKKIRLNDPFAPLVKGTIFDVLPQPTALPMEHGGNATVDAQKWGLTVAQFNTFIDSCKQTNNWTQLLEHEDQYKRAGYVNAYQLNESYVTQWSAGTGSSVSLLMNEEPLAASVMISHGWGEDVSQVQRMLHQSVSGGSLKPTTVIWFCVLANYQPEDGVGPSISKQLAMDPFGSVIRSANKYTGGLFPTLVRLRM